MKIKRFEAPNMSEALRMIKKEFGEDAVILSAKSVKKTRSVFGAKRSGKVVVTAAIDRSPAQAAAMDASVDDARKTGVSTAVVDDDRQVRPNSMRDHYTPITKTGQQKLRSKFVRLMADNHEDETRENEQTADMLSARLKEQAVDDRVLNDLVEQVCALMPSGGRDPRALRSAFAQVISEKGIVCDHGSRSRKVRTLVMIGAAGTGKTTMAARFAADAVISGKQVAIISTDDQRIAGAGELERYGQLMNIPMHTAFDQNEMRLRLDRCRHADVIVVDTPGISSRSGKSLEKIKAMLDLLKHADVHLCLNATASREALDSQISFFRSLRPGSLVFTQLDWARRFGELLNVVMRAGLPVACVSDNAHVTEGIALLSPDAFAALLLTGDLQKSDEAPPDVTVVEARDNRSGSLAEDRFAANRNSDIFHRTHCRAVQRINDDNIVMFENEQEAMDQHFKPCRMCCSDLYTPKTIERPALRPAAGNRYYA